MYMNMWAMNRNGALTVMFPYKKIRELVFAPTNAANK